MEGKIDLKEVILGKLGSIKVQDVTLVVLCALVIYLLRVRDEHIISPQWRYHFNLTDYPNEKFPTYSQRLPRPIITDLEGDGISEVVLVNTALHLEVHILPPGGPVKVLPHLEVKNATKLPRRRNADALPGYPVAMETGFLTMYSLQTRNQVIVVFLDDWSVLCYDNELRLLWQQQLLDVGEIREEYYIKSVAILITSTQVARGDRGLVVVGASFAHKSHGQKSRPLESFDRSDVHPAKQHQAHIKPRDTANTTTTEDTFTHFSTFALSGTDGTVRWHHLPGDFEFQPAEEGRVHHWKLGLKRNLGHIGEEPWARYTEDLFQQMPYAWGSLYDTHIEVAKLKKNKRTQILTKPTSEADGITAAQDLLGLSAEHLIGKAYGGMKPHSRHDHVTNPNAVIIHNHKGIEALSITSGRPVTRIEFLDEKAAFADVNEDGNLERIKANFEENSCQAEVATLQPSLEVLYSGPLCDSPGLWSQLSLSSAFYPEIQVSEDTHIALAPVVVKSIAHRTSVSQHLLGHTLPSQRLGYDTLYMTSTGRITSYGPKGEFNWQAKVPARWSEIAHTVQTGSFSGSVIQELFKTAFHPSMTPLAHQVFDKKTLLLAVGWDHMSITNLVNGDLYAEHSLPCQPISPPVIGDYNNDGLNDIIISCPLGYFGFILESQPNYVYMSLISVTVVLTILLLTWCFKPDKYSGMDDEDW